jgi:putative ABC transport system ATP-binding protein
MTTAAAPATPVVVLEGLGKVYSPGTPAEVVALHDATARIDAGEFVAIMGASGSGKSTLMNLLGCLDTPSAGRCLIDGVDIATLDAEQRAQLRLTKIGFVFQGFNLLGRMSALENVMLPLTYAGVPRAQRVERATSALREVGLGERMAHKPAELSGGQQQRVAIARAIVTGPTLLVADEPTGALDSKTGEEILALFDRLRTAGHTLVLITHDAAVAAHAKRTLHMADGVLLESTTPPEPRA